MQVAHVGRVFDFTEIDHFLITHVHGDHMNGLEGVAFFKHFVENKRVQLLSVPEVREVIWERAPEREHGPVVERQRVSLLDL